MLVPELNGLVEHDATTPRVWLRPIAGDHRPAREVVWCPRPPSPFSHAASPSCLSQRIRDPPDSIKSLCPAPRQANLRSNQRSNYLMEGTGSMAPPVPSSARYGTEWERKEEIPGTFEEVR
jgi:hypothetical protein